jgi:hypothetical protein
VSYSRQSPSPRYLELLDQYRRLHREGNPAKGVPAAAMFNGMSLPRQAHHIRALVAHTAARTLLDYGSGKGAQYLDREIREDGVVKWRSIQEYWGVDSIRCYDPGYEPHAALPSGRFHGVVSTDVLEHCPEEDLAWIVAELFAYGERFVFANVACFPAVKVLPSGENAHSTVRPVDYWRALFEACAAGCPGVLWEMRADVLRNDELAEVRCGNFAPPENPLR